MTLARTISKPSGCAAIDAADSSLMRENRPSGIHPATPRKKGRQTKWTVVDQFVHGGHRYQLRCQPVEQRGHGAVLTEREEEVLACAMDGQSNKSIAYSLGVAPSTVGVLLFRAATKLGVKSRSDLLSTYARRKIRSEIGRAHV